jgi:hypothetical protein
MKNKSTSIILTLGNNSLTLANQLESLLNEADLKEKQCFFFMSGGIMKG